MLSKSDTSFIDNLSTRTITDFRNDTFTKDFIDGNPQIFLSFEWINIAKLKIFIGLGVSVEMGAVTKVESALLSARDTIAKTEEIEPAVIKKEPVLDEWSHGGGFGRVTSTIRTRTSHAKTGHEVIEILSDSDSEAELPVSKKGLIGSIMKTDGEKKGKGEEEGTETPKIQIGGGNKGKQYLPPFDPSEFTKESETIWTDSNAVSFVIEGAFQVTKELRVDRVEYLTDIPCVWPIPRIQTAFILDLRDDAKYLVRKETGKIATPVTPDFLLKNKDQDSWKGGTGTADSTAQVTFQRGFPSVTCRRSRLVCKGVYACSGIDPALLDVERHDLDPAPRLKVFEAEKATRVGERSSVEQRAATFLNVCRSRCPAVDSNGKACMGQPKMKEKAKVHSGSRAQSYFVACDGWRKDFKTGHQTHTIPDNVNDEILAKLMAGHPLEAGSDTNLCSLIVSSHIGLKQALCPHPHIQGGRSDNRLAIVNHPCFARRTVYIPVDTSLRVALVVHKHVPHNHPMPRIDKASFETKVTYQKCVEAAGTLGATVQKVDRASSTSLLLGGKTPGQYDSSLLNGRIKQEIVHSTKKAKAPAGNGIAGAYHLYLEERNKPIEERYIQSFINTPDGGTLIFTCVPALLKLIHEVTSFECDVTFKRVQVLNEWEMVIYFPPVERAITIARVYINKADADTYTRLFDELQELTLRLTGKALRFKRFSPDGNLLCMNADMEAAQILGAGRSFMKTNDTPYSKIDVRTPEELLPFFVRVCLTHSKRGVLDFKSLVTASDYRRILDFPYMKSQAELDDFTLFVTSLGIKKIQDWWNHKIKSVWIIPCILQSQSKILPKDWSMTPATTNVGESQHHWTNSLTGTGLSLLEGIQTARLVDEQVAEEAASSQKTGIMKNKQTSLFHQQNRANQRLMTTARKTRKETVMQDSLTSIQTRIDSEKITRQQSLLRQREYEESLKSLTDNGAANSRMSIARFEETSQLRKKIDNEKDLRRRSAITRNSLADELSEISASASGKPTAGVAKKLVVVIPEEVEASSSGRVSVAFAQVEFAQRRAQVGSSEEVESYSDAEKLEEDDDPDAAVGEFDSNPPHSYCPQSTHEDSEGPTNGSFQPQAAGFMVPYTDNFQTWASPHEALESVQEPLGFGGNDSNTYGNTSFTDLLMGNDVDCVSTFDFVDNSSDAGGLQWSSHGSAFANSDGLSEYSGISGAMSQYSSEGDNTYSESKLMYGNDLDLANFDSLDMFLPIPRIQTASPPPSPPAMLQSTDSEVPNLKRPRAAVAADLDTANILPIEHRRKRVKPARADEE